MTFSKWSAIFGVLAVSAFSQADITILAGPGNFQNDENVVFNLDGLVSTGLLVQGATNQTQHVVDFFDAGEDLLTPPGGQARVEAVDGGMTDMTMMFHEPSVTFGTLIWNVNAADNGSVTFTIARTGGADVVQSFEIDKNGENWFRFRADNDSMVSASLHSDVNLEDVRQVRIGDVVPEPCSIAAFSIAGAFMVSRRRAKAAGRA